MYFFNSRAFSNFLKSLWPLMALFAASMTYLYAPLIFSCHMASHVALLSCWTAFQRWPAGGSGTLAPLLMLRYTCPGWHGGLLFPSWDARHVRGKDRGVQLGSFQPFPCDRPRCSTYRELPWHPSRPSQPSFRRQVDSSSPRW